MEEFVCYIVKNIVDHPDQVEARSRAEAEQVVIDLEVAKEDLGKVIGRKGKAIQAIRTLVGIVGARHDCRVRVELATETEDSDRSKDRDRAKDREPDDTEDPD